MTKARELAKPIVAKHATLEGCSAAHKAYQDNPNVGTLVELLKAKAAFYDVLIARKGQVLFPGKAGAAKSAPSSPVVGVTRSAPETHTDPTA